MSKESTTQDTKPIESVSLENVKESFFEHMTPLEMMLLIDKMKYDLLCSSLTDDDTMYRGEINVFFTSLGKLIIGLKNNKNPSKINLIELICNKNID